MSRVVIACHSGYGHTLRLAQSLAAGAATVPGAQVASVDVATMGDEDWVSLGQADAIVFGAPTYMGGASAPFKAFADASSKVWFTQGWKNKLAGGFTCSGAMSGDKFSTLMYFMTLSQQHGMLWVGLGMLPSSEPGDPDTQNRLGAYAGVMAQAGNVPADQEPPQGDLDTAHAYGARIATFARRIAAG